MTVCLLLLPAGALFAADDHMAAMMQMDDRAPLGKVIVDQFEWRDDAAVSWQAQAWYGGDYNKLWLKTEGLRRHGSTDDARVEMLWDRILSPWWNLQMGLREDLGQGPSRTWLAVGVAGLAPGFFNVEATLYAGDSGRSAARVKVDYNLLLTQRWVLQPELEANWYGKKDPDRAPGSGSSAIDAALRLRYEIRREFAPYAGAVWSRAFDGGEDEWRFVAGVRFWF